MTTRHHQSHPPSSVKPNLDINKKPNYTPPEKAAAPNSNPSLGPVGVDAANARVPSKVLGRDDDKSDEDSLSVS